ncbi:MAG TPA: NAD(P)H-dependent oxidoreductase [Sphingomonas sp.]|jgi:FMN-dependent NADH-azoreductase|uniref:FMN-dependent NADH-azoreductase n=1 Tax=Sphingomonas sp. TaxID=28214 RepID=UPI002ED9C851
MNLLHLDSSILGDHSVSRLLSAKAVAALTSANADVTTTYRDLATAPIPHLSGAYLAAAQNQDGVADGAIADDLATGRAVLQEFLAADTVVIGVALYNFGVSSQLKAWVDRILIAGQTFRYGADGRPEGLAGGKRVILTVARGGFYGPGAPAAPYEHAETYMRAVLGFIGITDVTVVVAEGVAAGPEPRAAALAAADQQIAALAA